METHGFGLVKQKIYHVAMIFIAPSRFFKLNVLIVMTGKIIGGIIGAMAAGPWGAVLGAAIGHFSVDSKKNAHTEKNQFLILTCEAAAKIAKSKGVIKKEEIAELESIFRELNLDGEARARAIGYFRSAKNSARSLNEIAADFAFRFPSSDARQTFITVLIRIALADGALQAEEMRELRLACAALNIAPSILSGLGGTRNSSSSAHSSSASQDLAEAYAVLGVKPDASLDEIKTIYRKKCKDLHPDVLRSKGLGEFAMKAIEAELIKVNEAYERIMKARR